VLNDRGRMGGGGVDWQNNVHHADESTVAAKLKILRGKSENFTNRKSQKKKNNLKRVKARTREQKRVRESKREQQRQL